MLTTALPETDHFIGIHVTFNPTFELALPEVQSSSKHHYLGVIEGATPGMGQFPNCVLTTFVV